MRTRRGFFGTIAAAFSSAPLLARLPGRAVPIPVTKEILPPILCRVNVARQAGSSILVSPLSEAVYVGDRFTIEGVRGVAPGSAMPGVVEMDFIATKNADVGSTLIPIWPPIIPDGIYRNVDWQAPHGAIIRRRFPKMVTTGWATGRINSGDICTVAAL